MASEGFKLGDLYRLADTHLKGRWRVVIPASLLVLFFVIVAIGLSRGAVEFRKACEA